MAAEIGTSIRKVQTPDGVIHPIYDERIPAVDTAPTSGSTNVVTSGGVYDSIQSAVGNGVVIYDVEDDGSTTAGTWLGKSSEITSLYDGLTIRYKVTVAGASTTKLNVNGLGEKIVYRSGSTKLTTNYAIGSYIFLYYSSLNSGCWEVYSDYDTNSYAYVRQYQAGDNAAGTAPKYPLLARYNVSNKNASYDTAYSRYHTDATVDTSTGEIEANGFIKSGGTSSQFLKADGSVDSNTYVASTDLGNYVPKSGTTEMSNDAELVFPSDNWDEQNDTGYATKISQQGVHCYDPDDGSELHVDATDMAFINGSYSGQHTSYGNGAIGYHPSSSSNYTYSFPSKSGTFAMTSDVNNYVPKSGGWLNDSASLYVGSGLDNHEQSQEGVYTKITGSAIELYDFDDGGRDPWYVKMNSTYPGVAVYEFNKGYTQYSNGEITRIKNNHSYNLSFPLKSGTFALTSDVPDPRTLPYTITIVGQNGGYNVAYDFNIQDIDEWIRNGSTVFLIVKQDESNPTNEYLRGTFPLVEIDYANFFLKFYAGKYNISLEYIVDGNGDVNKSNVTVYISEPFQDKISDLSTIRSNAAAGAAKVSNVQSDWNATSGLAQILNKPTIPAAVTESTVSGWGFTKNTGTLTGVKFNGTNASVSNGVASITASIPTVDATPTMSSINAVSSGGVYAELSDVVHEGSQIGSESYVDSGSVVTDLSGYATKAWVEAKGYLTQETDPTIPAWAKAANKPTYTASEVGALPDTTVIPTKLTQLTNDAGFIVGYTETDPTVPSWAKAASKPTYSASEITNDVGYLKYVLLQSESDMPANPDSGTLYLIPE